MKRREFISNACAACLSATVLPGFLSSCKSTQYISGKLNRDGLLVNVNDFTMKRNGKTYYHPYVVVSNEELKFPVCVYRFSNAEYAALWMQCSHQGAELQVAGTHLQCPAHGSEFDNRGRITMGPAQRNLRSFPVTIINNQLFIDLRKT